MRFITQMLMVTTLSFSVFSSPSYALKTDQQQPINVESIEQSADLQTNELIFSGDVVASQGSIKLKADKVKVSRNNDGTLKSIVAFGSPATFEQKQDNGLYIRSSSEVISYLPGVTKVVLQGNALIYQGESKITGSKIEYDIKSQKLKAVNNKQDGRVSSTFVPADFQNKK